MKRLLNEEFLYNGDLYFIKNINGTVRFPLCNFCPFMIGCIPTEIIKCNGCCKIVKK